MLCYVILYYIIYIKIKQSYLYFKLNIYNIYIKFILNNKILKSCYIK